jgi:hypothetical protein
MPHIKFKEQLNFSGKYPGNSMGTVPTPPCDGWRIRIDSENTNSRERHLTLFYMYIIFMMVLLYLV